MAIRPHLPLDQRFLMLRGADQFRRWNSLDDRRVCILCEREFSGRQVAVERNRAGRVQLRCPTDGCQAGPSQWVYPGNPLVSDAAYQDWQRAFAASDAGSLPSQQTSAAA